MNACMPRSSVPFSNQTTLGALMDVANPNGLLARCPMHESTALLNLQDLARTHGVGSIHLKDERSRLNLGSFKALLRRTWRSDFRSEGCHLYCRYRTRGLCDPTERPRRRRRSRRCELRSQHGRRSEGRKGEQLVAPLRQLLGKLQRNPAPSHGRLPDTRR